MDIQVTSKFARQLAALFRQTAAQAQPLSHSASLEAAAHALGAPNWDTLSGRLKAPSGTVHRQKGPTAPRLAAPVKLFVEALDADDSPDAPKWCRLTVTNEILALLQELHSTSEARGRKVSMSLGDDTVWDNSCGYLEVESDEVSVRHGAFRLRGEYRHSSGGPSTVLVSLSELYRALNNPEHQTSDFRWVDGALFLAANDALEFAELVAESADEALFA